MTRPSRRAAAGLAAVLLAAAWSGCASSNPHGTHDAKLLDDKVAADRIHAALRKEGPRFRHVEVEASRKGITLRGSVPSAEDRSRAEDVARHVEPDVKLTDQLTVR